jgi:LuxR family quorum-sensing system transcriptional regulator CciR
MDLGGFTEALGKAACANDVFELLCQALDPLGYRSVGLFDVSLGMDGVLAGLNDVKSPIILSNYTSSFVEEYMKQKCFDVDPMIDLARKTITPLMWEDVIARSVIKDGLSNLIDIRQDASLYNEICCPIHAPGQQLFALRMGRDVPGPCDRAHFGLLQILAIHFYYSLVRVSKVRAEPDDSPEGLSDTGQVEITEKCSLSQREQEVMLWTARGKSASSISIILGLTENTVNFYVKNAMRKLGTTNRVVAVVLAVRSGLIAP